MSARWQGLRLDVQRLQRYIAKAPPMELRARAAWVASAAFGADRVADMIDFAELALRARPTIGTWLVRPSASAVIDGTDLHSTPDAPPKLLSAAGIVEVRRPETGERLWGDVCSLGWYDDNGTMILIICEYPHSFLSVGWRPRWTGRDFEESCDVEPLIAPEEQDKLDELARHATRYLVVFGLLAESDPSPLRIEIDKAMRGTKHVYLGEHKPIPREPIADSAAATIDGRIANVSAVSGHLKRQRHGEGLAFTKWIYVAGYSARRWFAPRWIVSKNEVGSP